jgi:integrase
MDRLAIQQWVANKFRQGTGWQTVRNAWVLLSGILETAVEYGYLQTNPARGVKFPQQGLKEKPALITGDRLARLLEQFDESYRTMVSLIAATGLRIGELLALRWSALDLGGGTLAVRESVFEGKFQRPKTKKAARTIPLGQHAVKALSEHRARMSPKAAEDLVFANRKGGPLRESKVLTKVLQPAAARAGLGRVTWHQFRHIHSSLLNDLKVPASSLAMRASRRAQHLHSRRRCLASQSRGGRRRTIVRRFARSGRKSAAALENTPPVTTSVN